jgi:hypothetical protein
MDWGTEVERDLVCVHIDNKHRPVTSQIKPSIDVCHSSISQTLGYTEITSYPEENAYLISE